MKNPLSLPLLSLALLPMLCSGQAQDPERSLQQTAGKVTLAVTNSTQRPVVIAWVDFAGAMQSYGTLAPGQKHDLETYPGHLWKFGVGNEVLGRYRATDAARQSFTIREGAAMPPATGVTSAPATTTPPASTPTAPTPPAATGAPPSAGQTGSKITAVEARELLAIHNEARREVGVPAIQWSAEVSAYAQQWADHLATSGQFAHRPANEQRYGENLAANQSVLAGARMWYEEKKLYRPGAAFSMSLMPAAHYTQMVWRGSTHVGAGKAIVQSGPYRGLVVLVCNYSPRGNMIGERPY